MVSGINIAYKVSKDPWVTTAISLFFFNQGKKDNMKSPSSAKQIALYLKCLYSSLIT